MFSGLPEAAQVVTVINQQIRTIGAVSHSSMGREGSNGGSSGESPSKLETICIDRGELEKVPGAKRCCKLQQGSVVRIRY